MAWVPQVRVRERRSPARRIWGSLQHRFGNVGDRRPASTFPPEHVSRLSALTAEYCLSTAAESHPRNSVAKILPKNLQDGAFCGARTLGTVRGMARKRDLAEYEAKRDFDATPE